MKRKLDLRSSIPRRTDTISSPTQTQSSKNKITTDEETEKDNQALNRLCGDKSKGNRPAAKYLKRDNISFYAMIARIIRYALYADLSIPFTDETLVNVDAPLVDLFDPGSAQENQIRDLYSSSKILKTTTPLTMYTDDGGDDDTSTDNQEL